MLWFIILTIVMNNGEVYSEVRPATAPEYNDEATCNLAGQDISAKKLQEIGKDNGKVYYICQSLNKDTIKKALGTKGIDI